MTRFVVDAPVALRLVAEGLLPGPGHSLVAPNLLRSQALSILYRDTRAGRIDAGRARERLEGIAMLKIRLLGDRVSRATAFRLAQELDWDDTPSAEYLAVAVLQADALVTDDPVLRSGAEGMVPVAAYDDLFR